MLEGDDSLVGSGQAPVQEIKVEEPTQQPPAGAFQVKIPLEELRKRSIFLAVPMYGGMCSGMFARSVMDLAVQCNHYGIQLQAYFLFNESLITRARNYCADEFMRSDRTHLMFIDSDIGFNPNDVISLLAMASDDSPYDIIGGPYPKKCISWEKIKQAVDKGMADQNPNILENFVGDYVFNPKAGRNSIPIGQPCEVSELGTGFMMIKKSAMQTFQNAYAETKMYKPDHIRTEHFDGTREIMMYFQAEIDFGRGGLEDVSEQFGQPKGTLFKKFVDPHASKRYLSEDYLFCYDCQKIGLKTWLCPWMKLQHVGTYVFGGSLADLASIGAAATADGELLKKTKGQK